MIGKGLRKRHKDGKIEIFVLLGPSLIDWCAYSTLIVGSLHQGANVVSPPQKKKKKEKKKKKKKED